MLTLAEEEGLATKLAPLGKSVPTRRSLPA